MSSRHTDFTKNSLDQKNLFKDPFLQFEKWIKDYMESSEDENLPMNLSTIDLSGFPSSRIVFMRGYNPQGIIFFTNYDSNKGIELLKNNKASLLFYWPELERQLRVWGTVEKVEKDVSDNYFNERPKGSQAGAWISDQSKEIDSREHLEQMHKDFLEKSENKIIPRPDFWGGFRIVPNRYEFWQGRVSRLHDRFLYSIKENHWEIKRLAP